MSFLVKLVNLWTRLITSLNRKEGIKVIEPYPDAVHQTPAIELLKSGEIDVVILDAYFILVNANVLSKVLFYEPIWKKYENFYHVEFKKADGETSWAILKEEFNVTYLTE